MKKNGYQVLKIKIFFCCVLFILFSIQKSVAQDPPQLKENFVMTKDFKDPYLEEDKFWKSRTASVITNHSYNVLHYKLELHFYQCYITPYVHSFTGTETVTFVADSVIDSVKLNAIVSFITVDSVGLSGTSFVHSKDTLTIALNSTYQPGDTVDIKIYYRHNNVVDKAFHANNGFAFTDCSPEKARNWFPCWDRPFDKATFEVVVKAKKTTELCSNGLLLDSASTGDTLIYHWKSRDPIATYIMAVISNTNFNMTTLFWKKPSNPQDSIPIIFYYNSGENVNALKNVMIDMLNFFSSLYGEYPFEKLAWATLNDDFPWSGMENQTIISLYKNGWNDKNTTSHEFTHHWFGDLITHATWSDIFVKEGFPQYSVCLWFEHIAGATGYKSKATEFANYYFTNNTGRPIYDSTWAATTPPSTILFDYSLTYCKSACVLYMLRYMTGDSLFFKILKNYATDPDLMFKTATNKDFINKVNSISGQNLTWFFDQWLKQPNHPIYNNLYSIKDSAGSWKLTYTLAQTQTNAPFFKMPVEIKITLQDDSDTTVKVMNDQNNQTFNFTFQQRPVNIVFDPDIKIILKKETAAPLYCTGIITLTATTDTIEDGSGDLYYYNNSNCGWVIQPSNTPGSIITHFININTEPSNDKLMVYNMIPSATLVAKYSGDTLPYALTINSSKIRYSFTSNGSITKQGWKLWYETTSGVNKMGNILLLSLFPNPIKDKLNFELTLQDARNIKIIISNYTGKTVYSENIAHYNGTLEKSIDLSTVPKGLYIIKIDTDKGNLIQKFIAE